MPLKISTVTRGIERAILWGSAVLVFAILFAFILYFRPWYGTMDDGSLLSFCDASRSQGFFAAAQDYVRADTQWGMFRPLYPLMIQGLYCTIPGPAFLYLANLCLIFLLLFALGWALYSLLPKATWPRTIFLPAFFVLTFLVYRFHDLFVFPSLQEKLVLAAGAVGLFLFKCRFRGVAAKGVMGHALDFGCISFVLLLGFSTKAQFLLFLPALGLILWASPAPKEERLWQWAKIILFSSLAVVAMAMVKLLAAGGSYTSAYSFAKIPENLASRPALIVLVMGCFSLVHEIWRLRRENSQPTSADYASALIPATFPLAFLAIMAPWKIGDSYLLSVVAPFQAFLVLSWAQSWSRGLWLRALPFLLVAMLALTTWRAYRGFGRWSDYGSILFSEELLRRHEVAPEMPLIVPCLEGAVLTKIYLRRFRQLNLTVLDHFSKDQKNYLALFDQAVCRPEDPEAATLLPISTPNFGGSFRLYARPLAGEPSR